MEPKRNVKFNIVVVGRNLTLPTFILGIRLLTEEAKKSKRVIETEVKEA